MSSGYLVKRRFRRIGWSVLLTVLLGGAVAVFAAHRIASDRAHFEVERAAGEALSLQAETLAGHLEKYRLLPPLLSQRDDIRAVFEDALSAENLALARQKATQIAGYSGALDVVFADAGGRIFASARGVFDAQSIGRTELFEAATQGRLGREARSTLDGGRSYVFASSISDASGLLGVIAVFVRFDQIEATWSLARVPIAATNKDDIVFLSNRLAWRLNLLHDRTGGPAAVVKPRPGRHTDVFEDTETGALYLEARRSLPLLEWNLHVFENYQPVISAGRTAGLITAMLAAIAGLVAWALIKRREVLVNRMRLDQATALRLERLVRDRTVELTASNASLAHEVDERIRAEIQLRHTQNELIQAAKLAALGQMSAALGHEFNQPLAAIATQADNARKLVERKQGMAATEALARISGLVQRMSELSRTLLTFARKPGTEIMPVSWRLVIDEALVLVAPRAKKAQVHIDYGSVDESHIVMGGRIRMTQILINLLNNAIDALNGTNSRNKKITLVAHRVDGKVLLSVADNGPGISADGRDKIFDPFYTTKDVGEGLGIGLSVVYNIVKDLGGTIRVSEAENGGACFEVALTAADQKETAGTETAVAAQ